MLGTCTVCLTEKQVSHVRVPLCRDCFLTHGEVVMQNREAAGSVVGATVIDGLTFTASPYGFEQLITPAERECVLNRRHGERRVGEPWPLLIAADPRKSDRRTANATI